jgi:hypothetical protein
MSDSDLQSGWNIFRPGFSFIPLSIPSGHTSHIHVQNGLYYQLPAGGSSPGGLHGLHPAQGT